MFGFLSLDMSWNDASFERHDCLRSPKKLVIAERAAVGLSTVARYFDGFNIRSTTRIHIERALTELGLTHLILPAIDRRGRTTDGRQACEELARMRDKGGNYG